MKLAVCIITYQRPEGLQTLLEGIAAQKWSQHHPELTVVVVDNDAEGSAAATLPIKYPYPLLYEVEAKRGIPSARNTSVRLAGDVDFVVFVDDDETPAPDWLEQLLAARDMYGADVVEGKVVSVFEQKAPEWVTRGGFFDSLQRRTGDPIRRAATNNLLMRKSIFHRYRFNEALALTGGSDTFLFTELEQEAYTMICSEEAIVYDRIPATRTTRQWVLQRAYRSGNTLALCTGAKANARRAKASRAIVGSGRIAQGLFLYVPALFRWEHERVKALQYVYMGAGNLAGLLGVKYLEYQKTHGR
ncbi:hypothetical protein CHL76_01295 [Marinococcus halophilus]|uniref:Glycosyl transferase n=1 Tax=Marinococcus halophilus TaxID=1371 RepID=A0A510Y341_MARHA|nr:glycosyltransferase [Marinococcus halophilus]OZT81756.1 hypothetical protein CHL76_01295 [Marinococcus halophilus]GEK57715.1 glycosyl transferase [Marinococcus halophilus]